MNVEKQVSRWKENNEIIWRYHDDKGDRTGKWKP
ncbi:hypothetical protein M948_10885 [Virgibacillus sp. CM-4]|nr:hypothetical protein M948_10885 [Virgibacillus sp. CM-4]